MYICIFSTYLYIHIYNFSFRLSDTKAQKINDDNGFPQLPPNSPSPPLEGWEGTKKVQYQLGGMSPSLLYKTQTHLTYL